MKAPILQVLEQEHRQHHRTLDTQCRTHRVKAVLEALCQDVRKAQGTFPQVTLELHDSPCLPQAFASTCDNGPLIGVYSAWVDEVDDATLRATLAHELGHIVEDHLTPLLDWPMRCFPPTLVSSLVEPVLMVQALLVAVTVITDVMPPGDGAQEMHALFLWASAWPLPAFCVFTLMMTGVLRTSRRAELQADTYVARYANVEAFVEDLRVDSEKRSMGWRPLNRFFALFSTHPSFENRQDALRKAQMSVRCDLPRLEIWAAHSTAPPHGGSRPRAAPDQVDG